MNIFGLIGNADRFVFESIGFNYTYQYSRFFENFLSILTPLKSYIK